MAGALLAAVAFGAPAPTFAVGKKPAGKSAGPAACVDPDDPPMFPWQAFRSGDTCIEFTNSMTFAYQRLMQSSGSLPAPLRSSTASIGNPEVKTFTYEPRIATTTPTGLGDFKTVLDIQFQRSSGDTYIYTTLSEGTVALAGATAGYTSSVMNFWSGDFQFSATSPQRTVAVARYEYEVIENGKLGLSLETGVPTQQTNSKLFAPVYPDDPVLAARFLYETDPMSVQFAGMIHRAKVARERQLPGLVNPSDHIDGWAVTAGTTFAVLPVSEDDEISAQATYASNASAYLGTNSDLSTFSSTLPFSVETRGWSVVASYHRQWTDQWESNVFVSHLALDIETPLGDPTLTSTRYAGNLIFKPNPAVKVGGELGFLDVKTEMPAGALGAVRGISGKGLTGYLFAAFDF
jgi:hypothetical protein